jgi:light-regulated signal transduction histidine kinase (bacteriophytochrome)
MYRTENTLFTYSLLALIALFLVVGFVFSPDIGIPLFISVSNRVEGYLTFVAFTIIVNQRIRAQNNLNKSNEVLKKRTLELDNANKELESFSYSVSHDLRTPLMSIAGFGDMLEEDYSNRLDEAGREYIKRITKGTKRMNEIIDDLLKLSKVSRQEMTLEKVNLSEIAVSVIDELRSTNPGREVKVVIEEKIVVTGDNQLLRLALSNLLNNAWKYTGKTDEPCVEFGRMYKNNKTIYYVKDNGAGFDMSKKAQLFKPFSRLHSDTEFSGIGIGLTIVERVIRRHGGRVWAESEVGKGAIFYFTMEG